MLSVERWKDKKRSNIGTTIFINILLIGLKKMLMGCCSLHLGQKWIQKLDQKSNGIKGCGLGTRTTGYLNVPFLLPQLTPSSFDGYCGPVVHLEPSFSRPKSPVGSANASDVQHNTCRLTTSCNYLYSIQPTLQLTRFTLCIYLVLPADILTTSYVSSFLHLHHQWEVIGFM